MLLSLCANVQAADVQPELGLLEFLAEWERDDSGWMDPLQMMDQDRLDATADDDDRAAQHRWQHEEGAHD